MDSGCDAHALADLVALELEVGAHHRDLDRHRAFKRSRHLSDADAGA